MKKLVAALLAMLLLLNMALPTVLAEEIIADVVEEAAPVEEIPVLETPVEEDIADVFNEIEVLEEDNVEEPVDVVTTLNIDISFVEDIAARVADANTAWAEQRLDAFYDKVFTIFDLLERAANEDTYAAAKAEANRLDPDGLAYYYGGQTLPNVRDGEDAEPVATVDGVAYTDLSAALDAAITTSKTDDTVVELLKDIDLDNGWKSKIFQSANGLVTINGNGYTITGLNVPLISKIWKNSRGIIFKDCSISAGQIDAGSSNDSAAFLGRATDTTEVLFENCTVESCRITGSYAGAFIGYANTLTTLHFNRCTVDECGQIKGTKDAAAFVGYLTKTSELLLEHCSIIHCSIESSQNAAGIIGYTANTDKASFTDCKVRDNTIKSLSTTTTQYAAGLIGYHTITAVEYSDIEVIGNSISKSVEEKCGVLLGYTSGSKVIFSGSNNVVGNTSAVEGSSTNHLFGSLPGYITIKDGYYDIKNFIVTGSGKLTIAGGTFENTIEGANVFDLLTTDTKQKRLSVKGGSFDDIVPLKSRVDGYEYPEEAGEDGLFTTGTGSFVARIDSNDYTSLSDALDAAISTALSANVSVDLLKDLDLTDHWTPKDLTDAAGLMTINGNGKTLSGLNVPLFGSAESSAGIIFNNVLLDGAGLSLTDVISCGGAFIACADDVADLKFNNCYASNYTFCNGSFCGSFIGRIENDVANAGNVLFNKCSVSLNTFKQTTDIGGFIGYVGNGVTVRVNAAHVEANTFVPDDETKAFGILFGIVNGARVSINGDTVVGEISGFGDNAESYRLFGLYDGSAADITVNGGTYSIGNLIPGNYVEGAKFTINDGTFTGTTLFDLSDESARGIVINGGYFGAPIPRVFCAEGYMSTTVPDDRGLYTLQIPVVMVDDLGFGTLSEALDAAISAAEAGNDVNVTLLKDIKLTEAWSPKALNAAAGTITLDAPELEGGCVITGLTAPLFDHVANTAGIVFKNVHLIGKTDASVSGNTTRVNTDSMFIGSASDADLIRFDSCSVSYYEIAGASSDAGAFIGSINATNKVEFNNCTSDCVGVLSDVNGSSLGIFIGRAAGCHTIRMDNCSIGNSDLKSLGHAGGFIGAVECDVSGAISFTGCTVVSNRFIANDSVGGLVGCTSGGTVNTITVTNTTVSQNNAILCTESSGFGAVLGTVGAVQLFVEQTSIADNAVARAKGEGDININDSISIEDDRLFAFYDSFFANITVGSGTYMIGNLFPANSVEDAKFTISGGTFGTGLNVFATYSEPDTMGLSVTGGYFDAPIPDLLCPEGYRSTTEADEAGYYTLEKHNVAQIAETKYNLLPEALDSAIKMAEDGEDVTVTLLDSIALRSDWTSKRLSDADGTITVDGNLYAISALTAPLFASVASSAGIRFRNVNIRDSRIYADGAVGAAAFIDCADNTSEVLFDNCSVTGCELTDEDYAAAFIGKAGNTASGSAKITFKHCTVDDALVSSSGPAGGLIAELAYGKTIRVEVSDTALKNSRFDSSNKALGGILFGSVGTAVVEISGQTLVNGNSVSDIRPCVFGRYSSGSARIEIGDGTYDLKNLIPGSFEEGAEFVINGGTFTDNEVFEAFNGTDANGLAISGGYFAVPVPELLCAPKYHPTELLENGFYSVKRGGTGIVTYDLQDSEAALAVNNPENPVCVIENNLPVTLKKPTRPGYTFVRWMLDGETVTQIGFMDDDDPVLVAEWTPLYYPITYTSILTSDENPNPSLYTIEGLLLEEPTREGADFDGWYSDAKLTTPVTEVKPGTTAKVTLFAKWIEKNYSIAFDANLPEGASAVKPMKAMANCLLSRKYTLTSCSFKCTGYAFVGWNTSADGTGNHYPDKGTILNPDVSGEALTLFAMWQKLGDAYNIKFDVNEGTGTVTDVSATYGKKVTLPRVAKVISRAGYTFAGWALESEGSVVYKDGASVQNICSDGDEVTLYAVWNPIIYTASYSLNGGKLVGTNPKNYTVEAGEVTLIEPTKTGYTFNGWLESGTPVTTLPQIPAKGTALKLTASWTANSYTVVLEGNDADSGDMKDLTCTYNLAAKLPAIAYTERAVSSTVGTPHPTAPAQNTQISRRSAI